MLKVKNAVCQVAVEITGTPAAGAITLNADKYPGIQMSYSELGLRVVYHTKDGREVTGLVPPANVKCLILEND